MRRAALAVAAARRSLAPPLRAPPPHLAPACTATSFLRPLAAPHALYTADAGGVDAPSAAGDTIFALSTAPGRAALAVVRASGPGVRAGVAALLPAGRALPPPRHATLVPLREAGSGELLDRCLLLLFAAPRSATGEDVAELQLHGGPAVVAGVLAALSRLPGWRPARAGEFARRAFHGGVLDLTAAEGLADLLNAETAEQRRQALLHAGGAAGAQWERWRKHALRCLAHVEAAIDFGEDERLGAHVAADVARAAAALRAELAAQLGGAGDGCRRGELVREGVRCVLGGVPNAGKSSLLNTLAGRDVAIVAAQAGTTRDLCHVALDLGGHKVLLADGAGLRPTHDAVEAEGVRRARGALAAAHLRVLVLDATSADDVEEADWPEQSVASSVSPTSANADNLVVVLNKADLLTPAQRSAPPAALLPPWLAARCSRGGPHAGPWLLSCRTGEGVAPFCDALRGATEALLSAGAASGAAPAVVTRLRHAAALRECVACLDRYAAAPPGADELAAEELRAAAAALGRVTGATDVEDVLDIIFAEFCIGK